VPFLFAAAFALTADPTPNVAGTPLQSNLEYAQPIVGNWTYESTNEGSRATFSNSSGLPQLTIRCTRSTRRVAIVKAASFASPSLWIWTSSEKMSLPATYDSSTSLVSTDLGAYDPLLDAIASSRGRIGFSSSGLQALVVPPWADIARVIEDCRV
jgi:hypothetical protein